MLNWSYAVTSVDTRDFRVLKATLDSLTSAGFPSPVLFMDGIDDSCTLGAFGNWIRAAWGLYLRDPNADRYCIFQDDLEAVSNLRLILDASPIEDKQYLNLYSVDANSRDDVGWHPVKSKGQGALGLVFTNQGLRDVLTSDVVVNHPKDPKIGKVDIDGTIAYALMQKDYVELSHSPSLLKHTGDVSTIGNAMHPKEAEGWHKDVAQGLHLKVKPTILEDREPKIGFIGYNALTGLGEKSRQITTYLPISRWLIPPNHAYTASDYVPNCDYVYADTSDAGAIDGFVRSVDVVLFDESPIYPDILELCKGYGKRVVCVPAIEWTPVSVSDWLRYVDLFICPTEQCYYLLKDYLPSICFPWPVDTQRFEFKQRDICRQFLFCHGQGGVHDRKGGDVLRRALEVWPEMPVIIRSQQKQSWPAGASVLGQASSNSELYDLGDVLISPHSVDGTGLEHMEAMSCGMPVITTNGSPWNEAPALGRLSATLSVKQIGRPIDWYSPDPYHLVRICKEWLGEDISVSSRLVRKWAESRSFDVKAEQLAWLVRYGNMK